MSRGVITKLGLEKYNMSYNVYNEELETFLTNLTMIVTDNNLISTQLYDKNNNLISGDGVKKKLVITYEFLNLGSILYKVANQGVVVKSTAYNWDIIFDRVSKILGKTITANDCKLVADKLYMYINPDDLPKDDNGVDESMKYENPELYPHDVLSFFSRGYWASDYFPTARVLENGFTYSAETGIVDDNLTTRDYKIYCEGLYGYLLEENDKYYMPHLNVPVYYFSRAQYSRSLNSDGTISTKSSNRYNIVKVTYTLEEVTE